MALELIGAVSEIGSVVGFLVSPARDALLALLPDERKSGVVQKLRSIVTSETKQINDRLKSLQEEPWLSALTYYQLALITIDNKFNMGAEPSAEDRVELMETLSNAQEKAIEAMNIGNKLEKKDGACPLIEVFFIREFSLLLKKMLRTDADNKCQNVKSIVDTWTGDIDCLYNQKYIQQCLSNNMDPSFIQKLTQANQKKEAFEKIKSLLSHMLNWTADLARIVGNNKELLKSIDQFVMNIDQPKGINPKYCGFLRERVEQTRELLRDIKYAPIQQVQNDNNTVTNEDPSPTVITQQTAPPAAQNRGDRSSTIEASATNPSPVVTSTPTPAVVSLAARSPQTTATQSPTDVVLIPPSPVVTASSPVASAQQPSPDAGPTQTGQSPTAAIGGSVEVSVQSTLHQGRLGAQAALEKREFRAHLQRHGLVSDFIPILRANGVLTRNDKETIEAKVTTNAQMAEFLDFLDTRLQSEDEEGFEILVQEMQSIKGTYEPALKMIGY